MTDPLEILPARRPIRGIVHVPGSKSITNRALILAALAEGPASIKNALFSDDTRYMSEALNALGIPVTSHEENTRFKVEGRGGRIAAEEADLFIGNAGTAARFLTAVCALGNGVYRLDGVERMRQRPIEDLLDALRQLGVDARSDRDNGCPPLTIRAAGIPGGTARLRASVSSQYASALLMVAPLANDDITINLSEDVASRPYIEMTVRMIEEWGGRVECEGDFTRFRIAGGQRFAARDYEVEPDASSASYFFAAAAVTGGKVRIPGLGGRSLQGDTRFVDILRQMGCRVDQAQDAIEVEGARPLRGVDVDMNEISDTVMTLAAIAPFAETPTTIRNVAHIRFKETDRIRALAAELARLGVPVEEQPDGLTIYPAASLKAAEIETYDDHRMAMAFAITGLRAEGVRITDPGCVSKTFPDFFTRLERLVGESA